MVTSVDAQNTQAVGLADEANPTTSIQEARTTPEILKSTAQRQASLADDAQRMQNAGKDLKRLESQSDSTLAKLGYTALRGIHWFGTNFVDQFRGDPFKELRGDLDRSAKQTDSAVAKRALQGLGIFYAAGSHAFKLPSTLAEGTAACAADLAGAISSIPDAIQHNGDVTFAGGREFLKGNVSEGTAMICEGSTGNAMIAGAALGIIEGVPKAYTAYAEGLNGALNAAAKFRPTSFNADPFDIMARNNPEFGAVRNGNGGRIPEQELTNLTYSKIWGDDSGEPPPAPTPPQNPFAHWFAAPRPEPAPEVSEAFSHFGGHDLPETPRAATLAEKTVERWLAARKEPPAPPSEAFSHFGDGPLPDAHSADYSPARPKPVGGRTAVDDDLDTGYEPR